MRHTSAYPIRFTRLSLCILALWGAPRARAVTRNAPSCGALFSTLLNEVDDRRDIVASLADQDPVLSLGLKPGDPLTRARRQLVAMAKDPVRRRLLARAALADLGERSDALQARLTATRAPGAPLDREAQVYDTITIGAGIHEQIFQNVLLRQDSNLKTLAIEATNVVAPNFSLAGPFFRLNSSNRATFEGEVARPGKGNLNTLPAGLLQVSDVSAVKYPTSEALGDVATVNRAQAAGGLLFGHRVKSVRAQGPGWVGSEAWPARYQLVLDDDTLLYANSVVQASGVGKPKSPFKDATSNAILARELAFDNPRVYYAETGFRRARQTRTPLRGLVGKTILVAGDGDSGKVYIEHLIGLGPEESYKDDKAQIGAIGSVEWVGQKASDCVEYITKNRVRYAGLAGGIKNQQVKPSNGRLTALEDLPNGRFRAEVTDREGNKKYLEADHVVIAAGLDADVSSLYAELDGPGGANPAGAAASPTLATSSADPSPEELLRLDALRESLGQNPSAAREFEAFLDKVAGEQPAGFARGVPPRPGFLGSGFEKILPPDFLEREEFRVAAKAAFGGRSDLGDFQLTGLNSRPGEIELLLSATDARTGMVESSNYILKPGTESPVYNGLYARLRDYWAGLERARRVRGSAFGRGKSTVVASSPSVGGSARPGLTLEDLTATLPELNNAPTKIAKRLGGSRSGTPHQIYFVGPAAGELARDEELAGVTENKASIFATGPRTAAFAREFLRTPTLTAEGASASRIERTGPVVLGQTRVVAARGDGEATSQPFTLTASRKPFDEAGDDVFLKSRLQYLLSRFDWRNVPEASLKIVSEGGNAYRLEARPGLDAPTQAALVQALSADRSLQELLPSLTGSPDGPAPRRRGVAKEAVAVSIKSDARTGRVIPASTQVSFE